MEELLDEITSSKPKYLSVCDLRAGYYQLFLAKNSRKITSFTSPSGRRHQWSVLPFGLNNSPYGMLYVLTNLFSAKKYPFSIFFFMDDLLCTCDTWESGIRNVKMMFQTLQDNNLTCNPSKYEFGFSSVEYLGLVIGFNGIQISPRKLKAIKKVPVPTNRKSLQRLFGLMNFYRCFIKDFFFSAYRT